MSQRASPVPPYATPVRVLAAVVGGYFLTAGAVPLAAAGLAGGGAMARSEAVVLCAMLGFVVYLQLLLWAFAERRLWRVCAVMLGGAAAAQGTLLLLAGGH